MTSDNLDLAKGRAVRWNMMKQSGIYVLVDSLH